MAVTGILVVDVGTSGVRAGVVRPRRHHRPRPLRRGAARPPPPRVRRFDAGAMAGGRARGGPGRARRRGAGRRGRDRQPAGLDHRVGPRHRRAGGPGHRLAGPAHGRDCLVLRDQGIRVAPNESATKSPCSSTWPIPTGAATCASAPSTPGWPGRSRGAALHVTDATNAGVTGLLDHDGVGLGRHHARRAAHPPARPPRHRRLVGRGGRGRRARPVPRPSAASPATSRRRSSARAAHGRGWPRPRSGRAACSTCAWASRGPASPDGAGPGRSPSWRGSGRCDTWGVEAVMLSAGMCVEWLRDDLGIIDSAADSARVAAPCDDTGDVWFVPALLGLGTPVWDFGARGTFVGITRGTGRPEMVRAVLEGVAHRGADLLEAAEADTAMHHRDVAGRRRHVGQPHLRPGPGRRAREAGRDLAGDSRPPPWAPPIWPGWRSGCGPTRPTWPRRGGPRPWSSPGHRGQAGLDAGRDGWRPGQRCRAPCAN